MSLLLFLALKVDGVWNGKQRSILLTWSLIDFIIGAIARVHFFCRHCMKTSWNKYYMLFSILFAHHCKVFNNNNIITNRKNNNINSIKTMIGLFNDSTSIREAYIYWFHHHSNHRFVLFFFSSSMNDLNINLTQRRTLNLHDSIQLLGIQRVIRFNVHGYQFHK